MTILLREPTAELCGEIAAYRREMLEAGSSMDGCASLGSTEDPAVWLAQVESQRQEATCPAPWVPATQFVALSETGRVLGMIRACRPDILLVCLGFPVQETWMRENLPFLPSVRIAAGLGGSLDVWAGKRSRAPQFMQTHGMEWAWRMAQSPSKLRQLPALFRFTRQIRRTHEIVD